jgi:GNAT superfamily N-acetyltransferase
MAALALTFEPSMGSSSLYAQFIKEVHGLEILEYPWGYATYEWLPDAVYIRDIFVVPSERANKRGVQLMHEIEALGHERGIFKTLGSVAIESKEPMKNYEMLRHLGFQDCHMDNENVYLVRESKSE